MQKVTHGHLTTQNDTTSAWHLSLDPKIDISKFNSKALVKGQRCIVIKGISPKNLTIKWTPLESIFSLENVIASDVKVPDVSFYELSTTTQKHHALTRADFSFSRLKNDSTLAIKLYDIDVGAASKVFYPLMITIPLKRHQCIEIKICLHRGNVFMPDSWINPQTSLRARDPYSSLPAPKSNEMSNESIQEANHILALNHV